MSTLYKEFNNLWEQGKVKTPLIILIGGYAGTGKSTLASAIMSKIDHLNSFPTGLIRAALRDYITEESNPYLYTHTYDLHTISDNIKDAYLKQCTPILNAINQSIDFANSEKQMYIFDGNHIFPGKMRNYQNVVEFYLKVSDPDQHKKMMSGPTHNRIITREQFKTARELHNYIIEEAEKYNKPVFEYNLVVKESNVLIERAIGNLIMESKGIKPKLSFTRA